MPIYEYECPNCSCQFEKKRSFTDDSPVPCPECQCEGRRIFSAVPIIFKGSGFYVTDHRGDDGHSAPTSSTGEAKSGDADKTTAGDTDKASSASTSETKTNSSASTSETKANSTEQTS